MKDLMKKQALEDYKKVLSTEAGRRVFGGIFDAARMNSLLGISSEVSMAYENGRRNPALELAKTIREVDPLGVAKCEMEYAKFREGNGEKNGGSRERDDWPEW